MTTGKTLRDVLDRELRTDPEFRKEWERTQIAREVALQVVSYRANHKLTQEELAARLGIDGDELEKTVHRFNGVVEAGVDHDFHRGENRWRLASATTGRVETTVLERLNSRPSDCRPNS